MNAPQDEGESSPLNVLRRGADPTTWGERQATRPHLSDMTFVRTVEVALAYAIVTTAEEGAPDDWDGLRDAPEAVQSFCKRVAQNLLFDLDGRMLLDLALEKLFAEQHLDATGERGVTITPRL
jgi:hypothetical protein